MPELPEVEANAGMTGKLARAASTSELPRFTRATLTLDDRALVCFVDSHVSEGSSHRRGTSSSPGRIS